MLTYGDGLSDIDVAALVDFHRPTAARHRHRGPPAGPLRRHRPRRRPVVRFAEKPQTDVGWINGGFFVFEPEALDRIAGPGVAGAEVLEGLTADGELMAYRHDGFFQPMDTLREKRAARGAVAGGRPAVARRLDDLDDAVGTPGGVLVTGHAGFKGAWLSSWLRGLAPR